MQQVIGVLVYCGVLICVASGQGEIGNVCTLESTGQQGECVVLSSCQSAMDELVVHKRFPQRCGFQDTVPIVCCRKNVENATTSPRPLIQPISSSTLSSDTVGIRIKRIINNGTRPPGQISERKCKEYAKYVVSKLRVKTICQKKCDKKCQKKCHREHVINYECTFKHTKIVGGKKAEIKEFPHQVLVGYKPEGSKIVWKCGGTIISEQYVMTAGHCLFSREFGDAVSVRMGITNLADTAHRQDYEVAERIPHPDYLPSAVYNDIGLLKLKTVATMTSYARPACLFQDFLIPATKAIATGWGATAYAGSGSDDLLKVTLAFVGVEKCNKSYKNQIANGRNIRRGILNRIQLCAGSPDNAEKDTCQGDSGGPLQIYHTSGNLKCMYDIVGVTSFGKACGISQNPGVYTRVSNYIKWIEDIVWP